LPLAPGQVFANDFELLRPLGAGGMGEVWLARERPLGREVALKVMRDSDGPARSERFRREARALAALEHPSILPVLRGGEDPATRRPFIAMRAVLLSPEEIRRLCRETLRCPLPRGVAEASVDSHAESAEPAEFSGGAGGGASRPLSLADLLDGGKALPQEAVLRLARDLAGALGAAHAAGILHRDVKPSNVLYDASGRALLADFGLAKFVTRHSSLVTPAPPDSISLDGEGRAKFLGSPAYAAPEQFDSSTAATPATDWYSFGAVLCRALTGHRPGSPRRPSSFDPRHVSRAWDPFLAALLEPDPARRVSETAAVLRWLDRIERAVSGRAARRAAALALAACAVVCAAAAHFHNAEFAEPGSHAEGAEAAEFVSHAEGAEAAEPGSHAEGAEAAEFVSHAEGAEAAEFVSHAEIAESAEPVPPEGDSAAADLPSVAPPDDVDPLWAKIASYSVYGGVPRVVARLEGRHVFLSRPLRFDGPANVEIVGPGRLDAEIVGTPKARVAILGGAAVIDTTEDRDPLHSPRFRLGAGAFLALPKVLRIFPDDFAEPYGEPDPENPKRIMAVITRSVRTGRETRRRARLFADCTGDAVIARLAGCSVMYGSEGREVFGESLAPKESSPLVMGHSTLWETRGRDHEVPFPDIDWGIEFDDSNALARFDCCWDWETGQYRDQIMDIEYIRDYGLMTCFANWSFLKNRSRRKNEWKNQELEWVSAIGGKRESCRVPGDLILTQNDIENKVPYEDATGAITWSIDLHFPDPENRRKFGEAFQSCAYHRGIGFPYPVPYRCLYAKDVENLFLGGRCLSLSHVAFSCVRVMRTLGMLGEVIGMAAEICIRNHCLPRAVYTTYLKELQTAMQQGISMEPPFGFMPGEEEAYHFMRPVGSCGNDTENCWYYFDETGGSNETIPKEIGRCIEELGLIHKNGSPFRKK